MGKSSKKVPKKFYCKKCDYITSKKSQWTRHLSTAKHKNAINAIFDAIQKSSNDISCPVCKKCFKHISSLYRHKKICKNASVCYPKVIQSYPKVIHSNFHCECGKSYKYASGLSKHKKKCTYLHCLEDEEDSIDTIIPSNNVETLLKNILEENKELRTEIKNLKMGNTYNNTQNNQFNINMFLNEKCKNAMNLEDFVEKIKLSLEDLKYTSENGYVKGISNIFIKNLNDMDVTERPIHCSDQKRLQFYIKNDDEWSKDDNNVKLDNSIEKISKKQLQTIKDWIKENPNYLDSEVKTDEYFTLVKNITQPNNEKNLKTIKKKVGENVKIDK
jgi:hypothetical protein